MRGDSDGSRGTKRASRLLTFSVVSLLLDHRTPNRGEVIRMDTQITRKSGLADNTLGANGCIGDRNNRCNCSCGKVRLVTTARCELSKGGRISGNEAATSVAPATRQSSPLSFAPHPSSAASPPSAAPGSKSGASSLTPSSPRNSIPCSSKTCRIAWRFRTCIEGVPLTRSPRVIADCEMPHW